MKRILALLLLLALASTASAQLVVGVHTVSTHFRSGSGCAPNNENFGAFVRYNGWEVGDYYNSHCANTLYGGRLFEFNDIVVAGVPLRPAVLVAVATGYKKFHGLPLMPAAAIGVSWPVAKDLRGRVDYTKDPRVKSFGVAHLIFEHQF